jgi:hypothetical protein
LAPSKEAFYRHSVNKDEMVQVHNEKLLDHSEFMFLAFQIYDVDRKSILRFSSKKELAGEPIALAFPTLVFKVIICVAGFRPGRRGPFILAKGPCFQGGRLGTMEGHNLKLR